MLAIFYLRVAFIYIIANILGKMQRIFMLFQDLQTKCLNIVKLY